MSKNISALSRRLGLTKGLFIQQRDVDSKDQVKNLADNALVGSATIESSRSFYDFMVAEQAQKKAYICNGSSCRSRGKQSAIKERLGAHLEPDEIGHMTCLGHCYEAGAFMLNGQTYDRTDVDIIPTLLMATTAQELIPKGQSLGAQVLLQQIDSVSAWYQPLLDAIKGGQDEALLKEILDAKLRGRGGAGFPAGLKWQACKNQAAEEKYIVCNADEGDPGAFSDRYLLERHPHAVLFGMLVAGYLTGANEGVIYLRLEYPKAAEICREAIDSLRQNKILAAPLNNEAWSFDIHLVVGAGAYICGEETALLRSLEGQRPEVSVRPPFPVESGLFGQPTVVNNVETFACCHWIISQGGAAFAALGTEQSAGVKLVSLDHCFNKPGVYEVPMGTPLATIIDLAGGPRIPLKAMHIGGPLGGIVPMSKLDQLSLSFESFAEQGFLLGHASIVGLPETVSMLSYLRHLFEFTAHESCGKCFPCRLGACRGKEMLIASEQGEALDFELFQDLLETMELGSLCALGGGIPLPARNIMQYFRHELVPTQEASDV